MDEFVDQAITHTGALGCDIFRVIRDPLPDQESSLQAASKAGQGHADIFTFRGEGFSGEMYIGKSGEFIVRQGSRARLHITATIPKGTRALRETLKERGLLKEDNSALVFSRDYRFPSVSSAAAVITGASANGRISWRLPDGQTYADWEESQTADSVPSRK